MSEKANTAPLSSLKRDSGKRYPLRDIQLESALVGTRIDILAELERFILPGFPDRIERSDGLLLRHLKAL